LTFIFNLFHILLFLIIFSQSTIINLLLRFYDPQSGTISLDGFNIKSLNIKWLRSQIGYVGQEPILFAGTIADNIAYGLNEDERAVLTSGKNSSRKDSNKRSSSQRDRADSVARENLMNQVIAAAKLANAHQFISEFPQGYETDVGSNGASMSGGQKQRIAIARALIKKPAVLLLDEATSALDATSERIVQQSIDVLAQSKMQTTVIVAHRLSTIRNADKICAIKDGHIAEIGTHEELLAKQGIYADLIRLQMESGEDEAERHSMNLSQEAEMGLVATREERARTESAEKVILDGKEGYQGVKAIEDAAPAGEEKKHELSKQEKKSITRRIWALLLQYPGLLAVGLIGACLFGAVFPGWGLMLANSQNMFYLQDSNELRRRAALYAYYYILLAGVALISSTMMYYGTMAVSFIVLAMNMFRWFISCFSLLLFSWEKKLLPISAVLFLRLYFVEILLFMIARRILSVRKFIFFFLFNFQILIFSCAIFNLGTLTTRLADDSTTINKAFGMGLAKQLQAAFTLLIGLALGFSAAWQIAFVVLACFPLSIASSAVQMQAMKGQQYDTEEDDGAAPAPVEDKKKKTTPGAASGTESDAKDAKKAGTMKKSEVPVTGGHGGMISTAFTHMRTVSAFSMHYAISRHYERITDRITANRIKRGFIAGLGFGLSSTILFLTYALLFWYGAQLIQDGTITFVQLMTAILTLMLGALGLGQALTDMGDQAAAVEIADRIFREIDEGHSSPIDGLSINGITPKERARGCIEIKNLNFVYPSRPDVKVCNNYSLVIHPGETIALVGPSGSGKSTIINLLLRFYDPDQGQILLDDVNVKDLNIRWLRSQIGYVGQEPILFTGTVCSNVLRGRTMNVEEPLLTLNEALQEAEAEYAKDHPAEHICSCLFVGCNCCNDQQHHTPKQVPQEESHVKDIEAPAVTSMPNNLTNVPDDVIEACKAANAHDFIVNFTNGYETEIGEGSIMVSGGQKQRIAIARALIKKPAILLLDEATSALDAASERIVQQSIDHLAQSKAQTTIIIAHRLSTIRNADRIVVVDKGNIVEVGKHDELIANPQSLYKVLWEKQNGGQLNHSSSLKAPEK
jgi:ATP-binding cassette subfamily B (MDR/TAP) protein 1